MAAVTWGARWKQGDFCSMRPLTCKLQGAPFTRYYRGHQGARFTRHVTGGLNGHQALSNTASTSMQGPALSQLQALPPPSSVSSGKYPVAKTSLGDHFTVQWISRLRVALTAGLGLYDSMDNQPALPRTFLAWSQG